MSEPLDLDAIQARAELAGTLYPSTDVAGMGYAIVSDDTQAVVNTGTFDDLIPTVCTDAVALAAEARRLQALAAELEAWKRAALCGERDVLREERDGARHRAATAEAALSTTRDALKQAHGYIANLVGPGWRDDERRQLAVEAQRLINAALDTSRTAARPERALEAGQPERAPEPDTDAVHRFLVRHNLRAMPGNFDGEGLYGLPETMNGTGYERREGTP